MSRIKTALHVRVSWYGHFDIAYWPVRKIICKPDRFTIYYHADKQVTFYAHKGYSYEVTPGSWEGAWPERRKKVPKDD